MIDRYLYGTVDRISPEAPVPVIRLRQEDNRLGGAGNVGLNLRALGARVQLAGAIGQDANGEQLRNLLREHGIGDELLLADPGRQTTVKTRVVSQNQQLLRADREDTHDLPAELTDRLLTDLDGHLASAEPHLLLLQDYNKGVLSEAVIRGSLECAHARGVLTAVDPKDHNFWAYRKVTLFKPNLREMQQQVDFALRPTPVDLDRAAALLFDRLGCARVMITLSEHGIYVNDGQRSEILPTAARRIADVSGAGDSVISVAACGLAAGLPLREIARLANLAGAQVIAQPGVVPVDRAELERAAASGAQEASQ